MAESLNILAIEPYFGGPHADFLEGLRSASRHRWTLLTMPARRWRWRMRGAAIHLAGEAAGLARRGFDAVFASDFLSVTDWRALAPEPLGRLPVVTYFHENQLSVPRPADQRFDPQYALINLTTVLASDEAWFNSEFHRRSFLDAARMLLAKMPDFVPPDLVDRLAARSRVMPPGSTLRPFAAGRRRRDQRPPLTILWNHRWESDKNPEAFFEVLFFLAQEGVPFRLSVLGEATRKWPPIFEKARRVLADRIVRFGYVPRRQDYEQEVCRADIAVSTALHEFFGLPIVEAIAAGCFPLVPARLSYPEIIPPQMHDTFLYRDLRELRVKLLRLLRGKGPWDAATRLAEAVGRYDWAVAAAAYDEALAQVAHRKGTNP